VRAAATDLLTGDPQRAAVVLGDLNDEVEAATTQIVNGPPGSEIGTSGFDRPDNGDAQRLWNLAPRIPAEQRFSRIYRGRQELIDHIFVSHALVGKIAQAHVTTDARPLPENLAYAAGTQKPLNRLTGEGLTDRERHGFC